MKTNHFKILYFLIPMAIFAFFAAFSVLAKIDASLPLPSGTTLPSEISTGSAVVKQIYYLFQFGLGAIGIVAFGSIIYGAVRYMAAAGDPSAINEAKGIIYSALWGIGIALTSVILLGTINPDLVNFLGTGEFSVPGIKYKQSCGGSQSGSCSAGNNCYLQLDGETYQCMTPESWAEKIKTNSVIEENTSSVFMETNPGVSNPNEAR